MQTSTNKKALERTWTSQCQGFFDAVVDRTASCQQCLVMAQFFCMEFTSTRFKYNTGKHQENLTVLLRKQSWHTILVLRLQYLKRKHPNPSLPMHNAGKYTQVRLQESTEMQLFSYILGTGLQVACPSKGPH